MSLLHPLLASTSFKREGDAGWYCHVFEPAGRRWIKCRVCEPRTRRRSPSEASSSRSSSHSSYSEKSDDTTSSTDSREASRLEQASSRGTYRRRRASRSRTSPRRRQPSCSRTPPRQRQPSRSHASPRRHQPCRSRTPPRRRVSSPRMRTYPVQRRRALQGCGPGTDGVCERSDEEDPRRGLRRTGRSPKRVREGANLSKTGQWRDRRFSAGRGTWSPSDAKKWWAKRPHRQGRGSRARHLEKIRLRRLQALSTPLEESCVEDPSERAGAAAWRSRSESADS